MPKNMSKSALKHCEELFPLCRSITGQGTLETLNYIKSIHSDLNIVSIPSGTKVFDWQIPLEWNISDAFIADESGKKLIDFNESNLHVMGYSEPVDKQISADELENHLYSLPDQPNAIPYIVSYYKRRWGFCLTHDQKKRLLSDNKTYRVCINSSLTDGHLNYGEITIPGESAEEVIISTYICHPSMANNELSGPAIAIEIARWLKGLQGRRYTYKILFLVETIGALAYIQKNYAHLKSKVKAGFVLTCIGDDNNYSLIESRYGNTYADKVSQAVFREHCPDYKHYSYLKRGSDERQFCAPGIDLPFCTLCRTKFGEYPEYHTSLDDLSFISESGLQGGISVVKKCIQVIESNYTFKTKVLGEPQLGKRGLYPTISTKDTEDIVRYMMDFLAYADGSNDIIDISQITNIPIKDLLIEAEKLYKAGLVERINA